MVVINNIHVTSGQYCDVLLAKIRQQIEP